MNRNNDISALLSASARAKALENKLLTKDKLDRLCDSKDTAEYGRILTEAGYDIAKDEGDYEMSLSQMLASTYETFSQLMEKFPEAEKVMKLPYDCHNIKTAVKCRFCDRRPEELMCDTGSVKADTVLDAIKNHRFSYLPANMAEASKKAIEEYAAAPDPQNIDRLIDIACYEDMKESAEKSGFDFVKKYVSVLADLANITVTVRGKALGWNTAKIAGFTVEGGTVSGEEIAKWSDGGIEKFAEKLRYTDYSDIAEAIADGKLTPSQLEKMCRDKEHRFIRSFAYKNDACADIFAYVIKRENEIKNIRIIMSGKKANLEPSLIKSRIRTVLC